jgi:hypothetical protein
MYGHVHACDPALFVTAIEHLATVMSQEPGSLQSRRGARRLIQAREVSVV